MILLYCTIRQHLSKPTRTKDQESDRSYILSDQSYVLHDTFFTVIRDEVLLYTVAFILFVIFIHICLNKVPICSFFSSTVAKQHRKYK